MKSLVSLFECLLRDCSRQSGVPVERDISTIRARVEHEGDSFLTITLPEFSRDFERSLSEGLVAPGSFSSFTKRGSCLPAFLQGFMCKVFDSDGFLLASPCLVCIRLIRQICLFGKKVERPCSDARLSAAEQSYAEVDSDVVTELQGELAEVFGMVADAVISELQLSDGLWKNEFLPKHGPGATRESILGNQKWVFRRWHYRLEFAGIKYWRYAKGTSYPSYTALNPLPTFIDPRDEEPVRVVFVPKTLKTPRVIAVEPVCMQYVQQGLAAVLIKRTSRSRLLSGHVEFRDQTVNQTLARQSSLHGLLSTLDMSEASDRVSLAHVRRLFQTAPEFLEWLEAARSTRAQLPNGEVIHLQKFASMGSATCFPVEALVFFTSIIASMVYRLGLPLSRHLLRSLAEDVYVFGDDLIVPSDMAPTIADDLESLGFKVNRNKSFWTGQFRESCGAEYYRGEWVTPIYLRRDTPSDRADVRGFLSTVATANQLWLAGYWRTAHALRKCVERTFWPLPEVRRDGPAIGWFFHSEVEPPSRWNKDLQRRESLHTVVVPAERPDPLSGEQALAKCFRIIGSESLPNRSHLRRSVRPYALALKRRWVPEY